MARPKETDEQKVKKVYKDAYCVTGNNAFGVQYFYILNNGEKISDTLLAGNLAWQDALTQIRKAKIKAAKDKRKQANPVKVKEIKKHVGLTMYPSDKAIIVKGFGSVQKFLDISIREYRSK